MRYIITLTIITLLPLFAQDFLKGVKAQDLRLERVVEPTPGDTVGINDRYDFFYRTTNKAISPDGKLQAEVRTKGGFEDGIYIYNISKKKEKQIDDHGAMPKWSPEGKLIAYLKRKVLQGEYWRGYQLYGGCELWVYNLNTNEKKNITPNLEIGEFLWVNENSLIMSYDSMPAKAESPSVLGLINLKTHKITVIDIGSPYHPINFTLSPDRKLIAYVKPLKWELLTEWWITDAEIFIANIDGTGKKEITETEAVEERVKWLDDGKSLIVEQTGPTPEDFSFPRYAKIILKKK